MYVIEHVSKPALGILAVTIIAFWFAMILSAVQPTSESEYSHNRLTTSYVRWLTIHLTSFSRKFPVITTYVFILALRLLEGWWVVQTN
jgi:hypothetical protein